MPTCIFPPEIIDEDEKNVRWRWCTAGCTQYGETQKETRTWHAYLHRMSKIPPLVLIPRSTWTTHGMKLRGPNTVEKATMRLVRTFNVHI